MKTTLISIYKSESAFESRIVSSSLKPYRRRRFNLYRRMNKVSIPRLRHVGELDDVGQAIAAK